MFMKKSIVLASVLLFAIVAANAQTKNRWSISNEAALIQLNKDVFIHNYKPFAFKVFRLDEAALSNDLAAAPSVEKVSAAKSSFIIIVPNAAGNFEKFRVAEASVMEPALQAAFPEIRSYTGQGIDEPSSTIRFSITPLGFNAMILSSVRKTIYINSTEPGSGHCIVFDRDNLSKQKEVFDCTLEAVVNSNIQGNSGIAQKNADDSKLRTYRLALCVNGEFSVAALNGAGGTDAQKKAIVLAVLTTDLTRANGIYERDFGVHLNFVANETSLIYLVASTDPFTNSGSWNTQTQTTCDNVIGNSNYDIGHLIAKVANSSGNNGNAGCIGCVCKTGSKGSGFSAHTDVQGDPLVVDYWTHEMGHQFGANHTFTFSNENTAVQVEPGSGSTIMGYAGITGATDIQAHSDDYFQAFSISQITDYIKTGSGAGCAVVTNTGDATPTADAGIDYTVPKSTPFVLTGSGSDADAGDVLSYCWEQIDDYVTGSNTYPSTAATTGPVFRSFSPNSGVTRTLPGISSVLAGTNNNKWEALPAVARNLNFRFTVRDNHAGGGNNNSDDMMVTVSSTTGPFLVTQPNTQTIWAPGSQQTVTWSVNGTNAAPINCANVKISLSTDGGVTYSTILAASTANDGSELVTMPNTTSTQARVKIEAIDNIFFDISDFDFVIDIPAPCDIPADLTAINVTAGSATLLWTGVGAALSYDVDYKPASSGIWINAATASPSTSVDLSGLTGSTLYDCRVRSNCTGGSSAYANAQFTTSGGGLCPGNYDLGNNNNLANAVQIPINTNITGLINTATDKDYYKFTLANAGNITITLTNLPADYDLNLLNSSNVVLKKSKLRGTASETITYSAPAGTLYIKINGFSGANNTSLCYTLNVSAPNGIIVTAQSDDAVKAQTGIKIYPNPAKDIVYVNLDKETKNSVLRIYDLYGRAVITKNINDVKTGVSINQLPGGLYIVKVYAGNGELLYNTKFMKQ